MSGISICAFEQAMLTHVIFFLVPCQKNKSARNQVTRFQKNEN